MSGQSLIELLRKALGEIAKTGALSGDQKSKYLSDNRPIPPNIPVGSGEMVFTSQEGLQAIHEFGLRWRLESQHRKRRLNPARTRILAVQVFGEVLAEGVLREDDLETAHRELKRRLDARLAAAGHSVFHYFPCHIFDTNVGAFEVGLYDSCRG